MSPAALKGPPKRDRSGFYATPHGKFISVTTALGKGIAKPALTHWAASEVARAAVDHVPRLVQARGQTARAECFDWLRKAAETKRDKGAELGSAVHRAVECEVLGQPRPEPSAEQAPFIDAFFQFCVDWAPRWEATELVLAHPEHGWAGTGDAWAVIPGLDDAMVIIDWKSGRGVYDEAAYQLAAYSRATVGWLRDGTEVTPPAVARAAVVHLRPDAHPETGGYALMPVDISDESYTEFLHALALAKRRTGLIGEQLMLPAAA